MPNVRVLRDTWPPRLGTVHMLLHSTEVFCVPGCRFLVDDFTLSSKAAALREAVVADGLEVSEGTFFTAGYDPVRTC
jgi:hypothetical protein